MYIYIYIYIYSIVYNRSLTHLVSSRKDLGPSGQSELAVPAVVHPHQRRASVLEVRADAAVGVRGDHHWAEVSGQRIVDMRGTVWVV